MTTIPDCQMLVFAAAANVQAALDAGDPISRAFHTGRADACVAVAVNAPACRPYAARLLELAGDVRGLRP